MTRNLAERIADVRRLQEAARAIVERRVTLAPAIVESTGLSTEGVELGLTRHVEVEATDRELTQLVTWAGDAEAVLVILSSNVFVGALRALALARAASNDVVLRPSRRDPTFARALVEAANEVGDTRVRIVDELDVASIARGEIHVYGRDETIADVRKKAKVRVRGHGSGMGVAWISAGADLAKAARGLAEDIVVFDQLGCLSPRVAFVEGSLERASELGDVLSAELDRLDASVPRGMVPAEERAAAGRYVATMTYASRALVGSRHAIGVAPPGAPVIVPPPYRNIHVAACASAGEAKTLLAPLAKAIVTVGSDDLDAAAKIAPAWARLSLLGHMQRPPLDGPVDLRSE
ncbi:MAG: proline dehydrogenase [Labilithrix sp.]|nr:proline dehydrogenase [Labilithrix sp.]